MTADTPGMYALALQSIERDDRLLTLIETHLTRLDAEMAELRDELGAERVERQDAIESLQRVLDARTERFV